MVHEQDVSRAVGALVDAVNHGEVAAALSAFGDDCVIVEDIPPYRWTGASAPGQWLAAMSENAASSGVTAVHMRLGEFQRIDVDHGRAYAVVAGRLSLTAGETELRADGTLTFTLHLREERWLIDTLAWSGPRPS